MIENFLPYLSANDFGIKEKIDNIDAKFMYPFNSIAASTGGKVGKNVEEIATTITPPKLETSSSRIWTTDIKIINTLHVF